jgi:hypothetical protein
MRLNGTHYLLVCTDDVNLLSEKTYARVRFWSENMKERDHLEGLVVDGRVTVKRKQDERT